MKSKTGVKTGACFFIYQLLFVKSVRICYISSQYLLLMFS
ncbi:hypothetical protein B4107_0764 [Bacillus safensis]|nr:hypothetical protein B4107_0764 [Bacillus safensis]